LRGNQAGGETNCARRVDIGNGAVRMAGEKTGTRKDEKKGR